jgi:two-component system response regulator FixJ
MTDSTVFVVSDDSALRDSVAEIVASAGLCASAFSSDDALLAAIGAEQQGCLVLDVRLCRLVGAERLARFSAMCATRSVLLLIDRGDVPTAVCALQCGALDVVEKPYRDENLLERIKRAVAAPRTVGGGSTYVS